MLVSGDGFHHTVVVLTRLIWATQGEIAPEELGSWAGSAQAGADIRQDVGGCPE